MKKVCLSFFEKHTFFSALETRAFEGKKRAARPVPEVTAADKEDGLRGPWSQYSRDGPGRQAGELCKRGVKPCKN